MPKSRIQVLSYTNGMVPDYKNASTVDELLKAYGLNGDTVINVNGTMKYGDGKLETGDIVMFSKGSVKSA